MDFLNNIKKSSLFIGVKKGLEMDLLPLKVTLFLKLPIVRFLRFVGNICFLVYIINISNIILIDIPIFLLYTINIIAFIYIINIMIISIIEIIYGINKILKHKNDFEVRNSPLDYIATKGARYTYYWKLTKSFTKLGGTAFLIDQGFVFYGYNPPFSPFIKSGLKTVFGDKINTNIYRNTVLNTERYISDSERINIESEDLKKMSCLGS